MTLYIMICVKRKLSLTLRIHIENAGNILKITRIIVTAVILVFILSIIFKHVQ